MSNGNGTSYKPGSMGNIKDLLQRANETRNGPVEGFNIRKGRVGGEKPPGKETESKSDIPVENEVHDVNEESARGASAKGQTERATQTDEHAAAPSSPLPSKEKKPAIAAGTKPQGKKKEQTLKPLPLAKATDKESRFTEIRQCIESFDPANETGNRHYVFLPSGPLTTLHIAYGERRLSAILSTLVRDHVEVYRDEIMKSIAKRSNLFAEQDD